MDDLDVRDKVPSPVIYGPSGSILGDFTKRVLVVVLVASLAIAVWKLADLVILLFAGVLMAVGLRATVERLSRLAHIPAAAALGAVVVAALAALAASLWFFGTVIAEQLGEVAQQVPAGISLALDRLQSHPYGRLALEQARVAGLTNAAAWVASGLASLGQAIARGLGYGLLSFFVALYLAAQPGTYRRMCLRMLPRLYHRRTEVLFDRTGDILRRWLLGQLVVMATIGTLSGIGLWLLHIEAAFALGLVGGLLTFIPYVGAVLAAVPATLVALTQGPSYAALVVSMYVGVHIVEGNFITPFVQAEATSLPPVLALLSTVAFSLLFGPSAVLLAAPLTLLTITTVEVLWVEQALGETPVAR